MTPQQPPYPDSSGQQSQPATSQAPSYPPPPSYTQSPWPSQQLGQQPSYGQPAQPSQYGQPGYGQPGYGQPGYGQPAQPSQYGQPGQPSQYGQPAQPSQYGQPGYGQPTQPSQYGAPYYQQTGALPQFASVQGARPRVQALGFATVAAGIAFIAFFALPYISVLSYSATGMQIAQALGQASSLLSAYSSSTSSSPYSGFTGTTGGYDSSTIAEYSRAATIVEVVLWVQAISIGVVALIGIFQWINASQPGRSPKVGWMIACGIVSSVIALGVLALLVLVGNQTNGVNLIGFLGFGYWLMLLGAISASIASIMQAGTHP